MLLVTGFKVVYIDVPTYNEFGVLFVDEVKDSF